MGELGGEGLDGAIETCVAMGTRGVRFSLTHTQTHRHTHTQTHRHTDTQTQRNTDT